MLRTARKVDSPRPLVRPPAGPAPRPDGLNRLDRLDRLDGLRGFAMLWMTVFHACFDLNLHGLIGRQNFYADPFWTGQRVVILSLFLLCAGAGQAVAQTQAVSWARFWRRWGRLVACALAVSAGSWWMFPRSWISFGVLHGLALMLLLARLLAAQGSARLLALAALCLLLPQLVAHPLFDSRWTWWVGLVTHKPPTEDFVPLLPWFGVLLAGLSGMRELLNRRPAWVSGPLPRGLAPLAVLGRWSLSYYMLHQPVLLGLLSLGLMLRG